MSTERHDFTSIPSDVLSLLVNLLSEKVREQAERIAELEAEVARLKADAVTVKMTGEMWEDVLTPMVAPAELLDALVRLAKKHGSITFEAPVDGAPYLDVCLSDGGESAAYPSHDGTPPSIARAIIDAAAELPEEAE